VDFGSPGRDACNLRDIIDQSLAALLPRVAGKNAWALLAKIMIAVIMSPIIVQNSWQVKGLRKINRYI
jgi:hypothetical protein